MLGLTIFSVLNICFITSVDIHNNKQRQESDYFQSPEEIEENRTVFDVKTEEASDGSTSASSPSTSSPEEMPKNETTLSPTSTTNDEGIDNLSIISGDGYHSDNWSVSSFRQQR